MDAFFASVEQRDDPALKQKPVVVGGDGKRSVVAAASYEARTYGVYSAMPMRTAQQKCPDLIIVPPRFSVYKEISRQIREIFRTYTDLVEPLSLDEAYLDITHNKFEIKSARQIALELKNKIVSKTELTCTAGISINKFLAKMASGMNKPDGLTVISPRMVPKFVANLPIDKFFGVGKVTAQKMHDLGIKVGKDLQKYNEIELIKMFGKMGRYYYQVCRGEDPRPVKPSRIRKSISIERTFEEDIESEESVLVLLRKYATELEGSMERMNIMGKTITLKIRFPEFITHTKSKTIGHYTRDKHEIYTVARELFTNITGRRIPLRLIGLGLSNLNNESLDSQLELNLDE